MNNVLQRNLVTRTEPVYHRDGADHEPLYTCTFVVTTRGGVHINLQSDSLPTKKLAYADAVRQFFILHDEVIQGDKHSEMTCDIEVILDLDNSGDLLTLLEFPSVHVHAFAARQYTGPGPIHGTLTLAKSLVHDATDLLIAYRSKEIVNGTTKRNILLVSKDAAFDSLYRELQAEFSSKNVQFVSSRVELESYLTLMTQCGRQ